MVASGDLPLAEGTPASAEVSGSQELPPHGKAVQCNIRLIMKRNKWYFSAPEYCCFQTPEYKLCEGKRETVRYVNINIYEINPEISALLWLWIS